MILQVGLGKWEELPVIEAGWLWVELIKIPFNSMMIP
jgi:hypothetical protein